MKDRKDEGGLVLKKGKEEEDFWESYDRKLGGKRVEEDHGDDDDEEEEDENDEEEEEVDDEDGEEEGGGYGFQLLRRQPDSFPALSKLPNRGLNSVSGTAAALAVPRTNMIRMLTKAGEQEKYYRDDWNEAATLALLQVWGTRFLQLGRKSLKLEDWTEVSQQVTRLVKAFKTDIQCRNRIDTLKKKYKREKQKQAGIGGLNGKWVYYNHMDVLLNPVPQRIGLPCAVDAGQIVRLKPSLWNEDKQDSVPPFKSASKDNLKVSQSSLIMSEDDEDNGPKNQTSKKRKSRGAPFRSLAKAIKRFGEIYEKMENAKQKQLLDLERTRMEFTRELELQKMQLLIKTQMELAKLKQGSNDMDASVSNMSG
eukprot:c26397_g1_i8 orf=362-1459(-)